MIRVRRSDVVRYGWCVKVDVGWPYEQKQMLYNVWQGDGDLRLLTS